MKRLIPLLCVMTPMAALVACSSDPRRGAPLFPPAVGVWKRTEIRDLGPADVPEKVRRPGVRRGQSAKFASGDTTIYAESYELNAEATGLDLEQTWRPAANTVAFHRNNYFFIVKWDGPDRGAVTAFVREIVK